MEAQLFHSGAETQQVGQIATEQLQKPQWATVELMTTPLNSQNLIWCQIPTVCRIIVFIPFVLVLTPFPVRLYSLSSLFTSNKSPWKLSNLQVDL